MFLGRRTSLAGLAGARLTLGQEQVIRLPFLPEPASPRADETVVGARERAHQALALARVHAEGIAKHAETLAWFLGREKTADILEEAALAIGRAEEGYLAAEAALNRARVAAGSSVLTV
jgi:hypothetical protein